MIERLAGTCVAKHPNGIVLDVAGVGYGVELTPRTVGPLADGDKTVLWTYTHVTEGAIRLFGFPSVLERQTFATLISASGLGPKLAMAILAHFEPEQLAAIIDREDADALEDVPGIGGRQSKKFVLELKPKFAKLVAAGAMATGATVRSAPGQSASPAAPTLDAATLQDLRSALENFGYKDKELAPLLRKYERTPPSTRSLPALVRLALSELTGATKVEGAAKAAEELF